jgi:hypothetical protein
VNLQEHFTATYLGNAVEALQIKNPAEQLPG